MEQRDIETLVVKIGMFAAGLNDLGDRLTQESQQATHKVTQSAQALASSADASAKQATARLEANARDAITAGTRAAAQDMERTLLDASNRLTTTTSALETRITSIRQLHVASTWKAFLAAAVAALVTVAAACALTWQSFNRFEEASWLDEVQRARASGTLQPCPEGGVCVYVNKRWHRLAS